MEAAGDAGAARATGSGAIGVDVEADGVDGEPVALDDGRRARRAEGGAAGAIVNVAGVDVLEPDVARDLRAPRVSVDGGVRGMSRILKSGWKAVKCSGTSSPSSAPTHSASLRVSLSASLRPGIMRLVISSHTLVSRLIHFSVSSTGSRWLKVTL